MLRRFGTALFGIVLLFGVFLIVDISAVLAKSACSCACVDGNEWANLTAGNTDCRADCTVACEGAENLVEPAEEQQILVNIDCIPGQASDCRSSGSYSVYQDVNCVEQSPQEGENVTLPAEVLTRTGGLVPHCVVPLTPENAIIECSRFSGVATTGQWVCGVLAEQDFTAYHASRPELGRVGDIFNTSPGRSYDSYQDSVIRDRENGAYPVFANDGICYRYGVRFGGAPSYIGFEPDPEGNYVPSSEYVCFARKRNTCGTPAQGSIPGVSAIPQSFSCRPPSAIQEGDVCFDENRSAELCAGTPGTQCCQGGTVFSSCYSSADCDFPGELCIEGSCVKSPVCDLENQDRECRPADPAEIQNEEICSPDPGLPSLPKLCRGSAQFCCEKRDPQAASACAGDKLVAPSSAVSEASKSAYRSFDCVDRGAIPLDQFQDGDLISIGDFSGSSVTGLNRTDRENAYTGGGDFHCLDSSIAKPGGGSQNRCTVSGQFCCNLPRLELTNRLNAQKRPGEACGTNTRTQFTCQSADSVAALNQQVGISSDAFIRSLASPTRGACQITPLQASGYLFANAECTVGHVCCDPQMSALAVCASNADCGTDAVCDMGIGVCLPQEFSVPVVAGDGCFETARNNGFNPSADLSTEIGNAYRCQAVSPTQTGAAVIGGNCIEPVFGECDGALVPVGLGEDFRMQCCAPGTGVAVGAAVAPPATGATEEAPFGIELPACIKTGNCGLEDILFTGAQFANFLIQISGAVFLAIFVYGGFKYLTAGTSSRAAEGKKTIIQAAVAMVLILAAFTFVNFVQQSLIGAVVENSAQASCGNDTATANFACQFLAADSADNAAMNEEVSRRGCVRNRCPGPENYLCCPL